MQVNGSNNYHYEKGAQTIMCKDNSGMTLVFDCIHLREGVTKHLKYSLVPLKHYLTSATTRKQTCTDPIYFSNSAFY